MLNIKIKTINNLRQRYLTIGDWFTEKGIDYILVSDMKCWEAEILIAIHELVESTLCKSRGIKEEDVMVFDLMFEKEREKGKWTIEEPGDDPRAIYHKEHQIATKIEKILCEELNIDWDKYEKMCSDM